LEKAVKSMIKGVVVDGLTAYAKNVSTGRFQEDVNLDVYLSGVKGEESLLYIKVFHGRKPYYRPWVEFYGISGNIKLETGLIEYFDSILEHELLSLFSQFMGPGGNIFVEYYNDEETSRQLERGFPPPVTRLGYRLFKLGFTWFKDWYFPEGFMEGGQKLQGEKPMNEEVRNRHLKETYVEAAAFLKKWEPLGINEKYIARAVERAKRILS